MAPYSFRVTRPPLRIIMLGQRGEVVLEGEAFVDALLVAQQLGGDLVGRVSRQTRETQTLSPLS